MLSDSELDGDGDGSIDYDEFVACFRGGASNATYAQQVADLFREFAPHRLGEVGSLLARYEYNKDTLLQALRKQYRVAEAERAKRDADRIKGCSSNSPGSSRPSSSGSVHPGSADTPPRTLAPIEGAPSVALVPLTPAGTIVSEAEGQGLDLMIIEEGAWQQASLGVSLIAKTTSPNRFAVAAAAALVAQEAEEEIQSRYDLSVWQTNEGVCVSERGLQEIQDALCYTLDEGQAEATAAMIIDGIEDTVQGVLAYKEERRLWEEKQARLAVELFCPSPRPARQRDFTKHYQGLRKDGREAYDESRQGGAFAIGLGGVKAKGDAVIENRRRVAAISHLMNRPMVKCFNAWRTWAQTAVGARSWGALQTATKWKFDKVGNMLTGRWTSSVRRRRRRASTSGWRPSGGSGGRCAG